MAIAAYPSTQLAQMTLVRDKLHYCYEEREEKWVGPYIFYNVIVTDALIKKYKNAKSNLEMLSKLGAYLLHGVDATKMKLYTDLRMRYFDQIIYNFPHAGFYGREENPHLIDVLTSNEKIIQVTPTSEEMVLDAMSTSPSTFKFIISPIAKKASQSRRYMTSPHGNPQQIKVVLQQPNSASFAGPYVNPVTYKNHIPRCVWSPPATYIRKECNRIFGEDLNYAMKTFGQADYSFSYLVETLKLGFERYGANSQEEH